MREMLLGLHSKVSTSAPCENWIHYSIRARHVPTTKLDLSPLPASCAEHSLTITPRPDISRTGAGCSLCLSNLHISPQMRLHPAQDSTHFRLWGPCRCGTNIGTADEDTTWRERGNSGMPRGRRTRGYVKRLGTGFWGPWGRPVRWD